MTEIIDRQPESYDAVPPLSRLSVDMIGRRAIVCAAGGAGIGGLGGEAGAIVGSLIGGVLGLRSGLNERYQPSGGQQG